MVIYSAESQIKNLRQVFRDMVGGMRDSVYVAYRLFLKDIKADYAKAKFGLLWDFIEPLVFAAIFFVLEKVGYVRSGVVGLPYVVFVIYGFLLYQTFDDAVSLPLVVMKKGRAILTHLKLSPESLILSVFFRVMFNAMFRIPIMLGAGLMHGYFSPLGAIAFLLMFPILIFAGIAVGLLLTPLNTIYNDFARLTKIGLLVVRFATPVMYSIPLHWLNVLNPVTSLLVNLRSLATTRTFALEPRYMVGWVCVYGVVFVVGWFIFHLSIPVLAERA